MLIKQEIVFWPFLIYGLAVLLIVSVMLGLSHILGERHREKLTNLLNRVFRQQAMPDYAFPLIFIL